MQLLLSIVSNVLALGLLVGLIPFFRAIQQKNSPPPLPRLPPPLKHYHRANSLMTPTEREFFRVLEIAVDGQFKLFSKVRLADLLQVRHTSNRSNWQKAFNAIQSKHVDFVGCNPSDMSIQFVVELDDRTHLREDRQQRDILVNDVLRDAEIPIFRFRASSTYNVQDIRDAMFTKG